MEIKQSHIDLITKFAADHGRFWRRKLSDMFMNGKDASIPGMRALRNTLGPDAIYKIKPGSKAVQ